MTRKARDENQSIKEKERMKHQKLILCCATHRETWFGRGFVLLEKEKYNQKRKTPHAISEW